MVIKREDNRSIVSNFNIDGINAVVGIDLPLSAQVERDSNSEVVTDTGTGSLISPYHVLTAGHVIFGTQQASEVKVRLGQNAADLDSRTRTPLSSGNFDASGTDLSYPLPGYNGGTGGNDLGLITLNESTGEPSQYIGLVTFVDPQDADNLAVTTAGFPGVVEVGEFATNEDGSLNIEDSTSKNAQFLITDENNVPSEFLQTLRRRFYITDAVKMFTASGTIDSVNSEGQLNFSATLDGEAGQSGSGYWTYLEGDSEPRVLGVYSGDRPGGLLLDSNIGALISTEAYDNIVTTMQPLLDENDITGNALPENAIVGSNQSDEIEGTYRRERILGNVGQDTISGGDADDRLEGGFGNDTLNGGEGNDRLQGDNGNDDLDGGEGDIDVAVFSEEYTTENYDYSISEDGEEITISHIGGTRNDGVDTLKNIEWALFKSGAENIDNLPLTAATSESGIISQVASATGSAPRIIPLPLEDGEETTVSQQVYFEPPTGFTQDPVTPPHVSLTAPVSMLDGDIDYTVSISPYKPDTQYNISYIVSTSPRTGGTKLQQVKDALIELNNYFIDAGVAENSNFAVIPFNDQAYLYRDLTASEASTTIQNLTTFGNYRNRYHSALNKAALFTSQSSLDKDLVTNIAYFIADGKSNQDFFDPSDYSYQQDARTLRNLSNVQAFGLYDPSDSGTVTPSQINYVDSNDGVIINDTANLSAELFKSGLAEDVVEVNILLDGEIVETITPEQLTDTPLGLIYEGSIDGLDVSIDAENLVTAEVVFNHTFSNTTVQHTVTAGESQAVDANGNPIDQSGNDSGNDNPFERELEGSDGDDEITLGYVDLGANGGAGGDLIIGNKRDNILNGGDGDDTIFGHGGNDTITPGAGNDKVDGGDGIDTVLYGDVVYQGNSNINLNQAANSVSYNNSDLLTDVEFIQFSDVRLSAETLEITPTLEVAASNLTIAEGSNAQVNFELDTSAPVDIVLNYSTSDLNATAGTDYVATSGQVTIPAGETTATVMVETLEDELYDESGESFSLNLTGLTGATFSNQLTELEVAVIIENLEPPLTLNGTPEDDLLQGGNNDDLIKGKEGNDFIDGGAGQDTLWGNAGDDTIDGGEGSDRLGVKSNNKITLTDTQVTGDGIDTIISVEAANLAGGAGDNQINASKANNIETVIQGNNGNDTLNGGAGNDQLIGNSADDYLVGNGGDDTINGGSGSDRLGVKSNNNITLTDTQVTGDGIDTIINVEAANLAGGAGDNQINASKANNIETVIQGNNGNDTLNGGAGNDQLIGNSADDYLVGNGGDDTINGGSGSDLLGVKSNNNITLTDTQVTGDGTDTLSSIEAANLSGGSGDNLINATKVSNIATLIQGNGGDDTLNGGAKADELIGNDGDDYLIGNGGDDTLSGGTGNDRLGVKSNNNITLTDTQVTGDGTDTLSSIEAANLSGGSGGNLITAAESSNIATLIQGNGGDDTLRGGLKNDRVFGNGDDDTVVGGAGNDYLNGGADDDYLKGDKGNDTLLGGGGSDVFGLKPASGSDVIADFDDGFDSFRLLGSLDFSDLGISDNGAETAVLIRDLSNSNQLLATVDDVRAEDLTASDFSEI